MATISTMSQVRRKKPATYGKASRTASAWNLSLDDQDEDELATTKPTSTSTTKSIAAVYTVQKQETRPSVPKPVKPRTKKQDSWDVPSSDDEISSPPRRKSPPKALNRRKPASQIKETEPQLAPWEKKKVEQPQHVKNNVRQRARGPISPDDQLMSDLAHSLKGDNNVAARSEYPVKASLVEAQHVSAEPVTATSSAAARLQARKNLSNNAIKVGAEKQSKLPSPSHKRLGDQTSAASNTPNKRMRIERPAPVEDSDVNMDDLPPITCESEPKLAPEPAHGMDIYDFPQSSADESSAIKPKVSPRRPTQKRSQTGKSTAFSSPRKMESAPARLVEMLPTDTDTTDTSTRSPSMTPTTPHQSPGASKAASPDTAIRRSAAMSPRNAQLWDRLLTSDRAVASPSTLAMRDLTLSSKSVKKAITRPTSMPRPAARAAPTRSKLVDRLKASAPCSDVESSDQDESESQVEDVDMDADADQKKEDAGGSQSQSQSQTTYSQSGPKVTYARTRSYLPEDSFEDQLLLDFPGETPQRPTVTTLKRGASNITSVSQKSAFDLDDSDEDDPGRMRTIHELRAGGGNQRFLDSLGGLLEDIADHNVSARSRRRSALMELGTKLSEKPFLEKFFRHGYERHVITECSAAPDDIADFALASILVLMLADEHPDHLAESLKQGDVLSWLNRLITNTLSPRDVAKDRRNNMSKSAQKSLISYAESFAKHEKIWSVGQPAILSPRTLALRAYDLLIRKLRLSGDRSELVGADTLRQIAPTDDELTNVGDYDTLVNVSASASAMESLSTIALSLSWPTDVVGRVTDLLVLPMSDSKARHLRFLTLRLSLNLTNDNPRNCKLLSRPTTILRLLHAIAQGFEQLSKEDEVEDEQRTINLDLLVLSMGVMTNLAEHNKTARGYAATSEAQQVLSSITATFQQGQERLIEAESVEQGVSNVAYGYLAVMLAALCQDRQAKAVIASQLPRGNLHALVDAVEEFVRHHRSVDKLNFAGEEGGEVWSAFTEKLRGVLERLKVEAATME